MEEETRYDDSPFLLFSKFSIPKPSETPTEQPLLPKTLTKSTEPVSTTKTFSDLGLAEWAIQTCKELRMKNPTPVQTQCIPRILASDDVLGITQTGSGKTAAFALPMLHKLAEDPYGVFALVVTPTRELAYQLAEQFRALGSCLHLRCSVVVGGMDMINQVQALMQRPHVVIATLGRIKVLMEANPDISAVFSKTKVYKARRVATMKMVDDGYDEKAKARKTHKEQVVLKEASTLGSG